MSEFDANDGRPNVSDDAFAALARVFGEHVPNVFFVSLPGETSSWLARTPCVQLHCRQSIAAGDLVVLYSSVWPAGLATKAARRRRGADEVTIVVRRVAALLRGRFSDASADVVAALSAAWVAFTVPRALLALKWKPLVLEFALARRSSKRRESDRSSLGEVPSDAEVQRRTMALRRLFGVTMSRGRVADSDITQVVESSVAATPQYDMPASSAPAQPAKRPRRSTTLKASERRTATSTRVVRENQQAFRESLFDRYAGRCLITGCSVAAALDAAHLLPFAVGQLDAPSNGLLLRADLHRLFDRGLIGIDPNLCVHVHPSIAGCGYDELHGVVVTPTQAPSPVGIRFRWEAFVRSLPASIARAAS